MRLALALTLPLFALGLLLFLSAPASALATPTPALTPTPPPTPTSPPTPTPVGASGSSGFSVNVHDQVSCVPPSGTIEFVGLDNWRVTGNASYFVLDEFFPTLGFHYRFFARSYVAFSWGSGSEAGREAWLFLPRGVYSYSVVVVSEGDAVCTAGIRHREVTAHEGGTAYRREFIDVDEGKTFLFYFHFSNRVWRGLGRCSYFIAVAPVSAPPGDCYCVGRCIVRDSPQGLAYSLWGSNPVVTPTVILTYCLPGEVQVSGRPGWILVTASRPCGPGVVSFSSPVSVGSAVVDAVHFSLVTSTNFFIRYFPATDLGTSFLYCSLPSSRVYLTNDQTPWSPPARRLISQGVITALLSSRDFCIVNSWDSEEWWIPLGAVSPTITPSLGLTVTLPITWWDVFSNCLDIPPYYQDLEEILDRDIPSLSLCLNFRAFRMAMPVSSDINHAFDLFLASVFMGIFALAFYMAFRGFR